MSFLWKTRQPKKQNSLSAIGPSGALVVQVVECSNLPPGDWSGLSDPFVQVHLGQTTFKTPFICKTLSPVYDPKDATFTFPIGDEPVGNLTFVAWDKDWYGQDHLGEAVLQVKDWFGSGDQKPRPLAWSAAEREGPFSLLLKHKSESKAVPPAKIQLKLGFKKAEGQDEDFETLHKRLCG
ncbi:phosphatidylserine decarboxylase [Marasmius sp. AFHP31]|nr:phosphatidylserine decarboxylase [Marasmius sp. AFHP31]